MGSNLNWRLLNYITLIISCYLVLGLNPGTEGVLVVKRPTQAIQVVDSFEDYEVTSISLAIIRDSKRYNSNYPAKSDPNYPQKNPSKEKEKAGRNVQKSESGDDISVLKYIGCYDSWVNTSGHYYTDSYLQSYSLENCNSICTSTIAVSNLFIQFYASIKNILYVHRS